MLASTHIFAATLLACFLPGVRAACDSDEGCDGLSTAARVIISLAFFFVLLAMIFTLSTYFKRRNQRAALAKIKQETQRGSEAAYGSSPSAGAPPFDPPQYPPPAHNDLNSLYNYDPTTGFAKSSVPPPQYYPPPDGVPPITSDQK